MKIILWLININEYEKGISFLKDKVDINYNGASGEIDFDENGDITKFSYSILKMVNGEVITEDIIKF